MRRKFQQGCSLYFIDTCLKNIMSCNINKYGKIRGVDQELEEMEI